MQHRRPESGRVVGGRVVGGRYRLEGVLGQGGMAVVWRAEHTETGRVVALELVRPELATQEATREMFVREARVAARVGRSGQERAGPLRPTERRAFARCRHASARLLRVSRTR